MIFYKNFILVLMIYINKKKLIFLIIFLKYELKIRLIFVTV